MQPPDPMNAMRWLLDREEIDDALRRYARGVDRGAWQLVRSAYHDDAFDDHGDFKGGVDALVAWLHERFDGLDNSVHQLSNCLIERAGDDLALVETYFVSSRVIPPPVAESGEMGDEDALCRQAWGRYVDRFERRDGAWRIAQRRVVLDARMTFVVTGTARSAGPNWGSRDGSDALWVQRAEIGLHNGEAGLTSSA